MRDPKQGTSSSYLIELRKLTTQKREDHSENDRMGERRRNARLSGSEKTARTWGNSQEETWAERQEECGCDDQVGLRQNETHRLRDETVDEEEHERVEHGGHLGGLSVCELERTPVGGQENTGAERQKRAAGMATFWEVISGSMVNI
ncbi:hypothetical protein OLVG_00131 [Ostreococcus lucimarinus virus OlV6]|nr:hypothetical protein OLVG_00131 [Ostreococcus lucimarinus virus OlV6]